MAKKVIYQITRTNFKLIEVENEAQEQAIKEANRDFERMYKQDKTYQIRTISLENLMREKGYDIKSPEKLVEDKIIAREQHIRIKKLIAKAIEATLTEKQKEIVYLRFWEEKTLKEIAEIRKVHISTIAESLDSSIKKLKKFFENLKNTPKK